MIKIAVSSGDPAGIGPDICIKAFGQKIIYDFSPVIFGDKELFKSRAKTLGINADIQIYRYTPMQTYACTVHTHICICACVHMSTFRNGHGRKNSHVL